MHFQSSGRLLFKSIKLNGNIDFLNTLEDTRSKTATDFYASNISNDNLKFTQVVTGVTPFEANFVSSRFGYFIRRIGHMLYSQVHKWQVLFHWIKIQKSQILFEIWQSQGSAKWRFRLWWKAIRIFASISWPKIGISPNPAPWRTSPEKTSDRESKRGKK